MAGEIGIRAFGVYVPKYRIKAEEYTRAYGYFAGAGIAEKAVARFDEDALTMGAEAAINCLANAGVEPEELDAVYLGTTTPPYGEKMLSSALASMIGAREDVALADFTSSSKAGTSALLACADFIKAGRGELGLVVAADNPMASPLDDTEHPCGAAAVALLLSTKGLLARIEAVHQVGREMWGGRFRRFGERFATKLFIPRLEQLEFVSTVRSAIEGVLKKAGVSVEELNHVAIHQPDLGMVRRIRRALPIKDEQLKAGLICQSLGYVGAASPLLSLASVLEVAKEGDKVLLVSHGSGTGSDAILLTVCGKQDDVAPTLREYLADKEYVDYVTYLRWRRFLWRVKYA